MTEQEMDLLAKVATDITWLIRSHTELKNDNADCHAKIDTHLGKLNGQVTLNTVFRKVGVWVGSATFLAIMAILAKIIFGVNI